MMLLLLLLYTPKQSISHQCQLLNKTHVAHMRNMLKSILHTTGKAGPVWAQNWRRLLLLLLLLPSIAVQQELQLP